MYQRITTKCYSQLKHCFQKDMRRVRNIASGNRFSIRISSVAEWNRTNADTYSARISILPMSRRKKERKALPTTRRGPSSEEQEARACCCPLSYVVIRTKLLGFASRPSILRLRGRPSTVYAVVIRQDIQQSFELSKAQLCTQPLR